MTANQPYDLVARIDALEENQKRLIRGDGSSGIQILPTGIPYFPGGLELGGGGKYAYREPYQIPPATNIVATWGSSFDTIYIDVSWTAPTGYGSDQVTGYVIQAKKEGSDVPIEVNVGSGFVTTRVEPVEPNSKYTISVMAQTKNGRLAIAGTAVVTTGRDTTAPGPVTFPSNPVVPAVQGLSIKWNANTERDVANNNGQYQVIVSASATLTSPIYDFKFAGTNAFVTGLAGATPVYVGVRAIDSSGNLGPLSQPPGGPFTPLNFTTSDLAFSFGGANIIKNSSFEAGYNDWTIDSGTWDADLTGTNVRYGIASAHISGTSDAFIHQDVVLQPGKWVISCWVKGSGVAKAPGVTNAIGACLDTEIMGGATVPNPKVIMGATNTNPFVAVAGMGTFAYTRLALVYTIPAAGPVTIRVYMHRGGGGACTGNVWFDGVQVEEGDTITAYAPRPDEILPGTITSVQIADNAITSPKIIAGAITAGKIAANSIGAAQIQAGAITAGKIAAGSITATEIAAGSITGTKIAADTITAVNIGTGSITASKIAANAITANNLAVTLGLSVGQFVQSANFASGSTGWRIAGDGNAEFGNTTVRDSQWVGGSINIANRIVASVADGTVHLGANVEFGSDYSGTLFSGDDHWGLQVGTFAGQRWTHLRGNSFSSEDYIGFFDVSRNARAFYLLGVNKDLFHPGPDGRLWLGKRNMGRNWSDNALIVEASGNAPGTDGSQSAITLHCPDFAVASMMKLVAPNGNSIEFRDATDTSFVPIKASAFLVNSSITTKTDVADLPANAVDKLLSLRPVKFKRPPQTICSYCGGTGKVVVQGTKDPKDVNLSQGEGKPNREQQVLEIGAPCPLGHTAKKNDTRSPAVKKTEDSPYYGLIAEDLGAVVPELVSWIDNGTAITPDAIDYAGLAALLVKAVQSLAAQVKALQGA